MHDDGCGRVSESTEMRVAPHVAVSGSRVAADRPGHRRASLLAEKPSAIMRFCGRIRLLARAMGAVAVVLAGTSAPVRADSTDAWLPPPAEDLEREDQLAEPPPPRAGAGSVLLRAETGIRGSLRPRRIAAQFGWGGGGVSFSALNAENAWRPSVSIQRAGLGIAAGRLVLRDAPASLVQRLRLGRQGARVSEARAEAGTFEAPLGVSALAFDGAGVEARGGIASWGLAGRRSSDGAGAVAGGAAFRLARGRGAVAGAWCGGDVVGVAAYAARWGRSSGTIEALVARDGVAWLVCAESRARPLVLSARWRGAARGPNPVAAEAAAGLRGRAGSTRLTWRPWSSTARGDNGALELDAATTALGPDVPVRARLARRPATGVGGSSRGATLDATVARSGGRSLALLASWRRGTTGRRAGRTLGGRLMIEPPGGARLELLVEATRADASGTMPAERLHASGATTLEERSGSGLAVTARGVVGRGPIAVGYVLEQEERADGARSLAATVWLRLIHSSPSGGGREAADPLPLR